MTTPIKTDEDIINEIKEMLVKFSTQKYDQLVNGLKYSLEMIESLKRNRTNIIDGVDKKLTKQEKDLIIDYQAKLNYLKTHSVSSKSSPPPGTPTPPPSNGKKLSPEEIRKKYEEAIKDEKTRSVWVCKAPKDYEGGDFNDFIKCKKIDDTDVDDYKSTQSIANKIMSGGKRRRTKKQKKISKISKTNKRNRKHKKLKKRKSKKSRR